MKFSKIVLIAGLVGVLLVAGLFISRTYYPNLWQDFSIQTITMNLPHNPDWEIAPLDQNEQAQITKILSQPYSYLGQGNQVYAFESADQKYVLKFFRFAHLKPGMYTENPRMMVIEASDKSKQRRLQRIFSSHKIAFDFNKDNAGLIYMQLNPNTNFHHVVDVKDRWGFHSKIDLGDVVFVLQKKASPAREEISQLLNKGDVETAKKRFEALIDLHLSEYSRGIYDQDHNIMHNTGYIGDKAIRFDVGKMAEDEGMKTDFKVDLDKVYKRIDKWLTKYYPKYRDDVMKNLESKYRNPPS